jgi:hypothetical protein
MKELTRTNDPVELSWLTALLADAGIESYVLDTHTSVLQGSIMPFQQRLVVHGEDYEAAVAVLREAGHPPPDPASLRIL